MAAKQIGTATVVAAALAFSFAGATWACGDKLVALGGGVGFQRVMVSRNPGRIVLLLEPATGLTAANDRFNLGASLSLAGHEVYIVKNADDLRAHDDGPAPDLILVDATRAKQLQLQPVAGGKGPLIMPVGYSAERGELEVTEQNAGCVMVSAGRKSAQLLKAVEIALKYRNRGVPLSCDKIAGKQA